MTVQHVICVAMIVLLSVMIGFSLGAYKKEDD